MDSARVQAGRPSKYAQYTGGETDLSKLGQGDIDRVVEAVIKTKIAEHTSATNLLTAAGKGVKGVINFGYDLLSSRNTAPGASPNGPPGNHARLPEATEYNRLR